MQCTMLVLDNENVFNPETDKTNSLLIIIDSDLYPDLTTSLNTYKNDLLLQGCTPFIHVWEDGTAPDLKQIISTYYTNNNISGALMIGNLPTAWYQAPCFSRTEQFPSDLYFMSLDGNWTDSNGDGIFESHTKLRVNVYTSRLIGTTGELNNYFAKLHQFRVQGLGINRKAYVFKDDDWENFQKGNDFGMRNIYGNIELRESTTYTVKPQYYQDLSDNGAEYVYQWIHSNPSALFIKEQDTSNSIDINEINDANFKGVFYNLFDCSASRFTQNNIAMSYLLKTDYALATLGSTKVGGNYYPQPFNYVLERRGTWGDAFKYWYNSFGVSDDCWFLGMTILGDPALTVSETSSRYVLIDLETGGMPSDKDIMMLNQIFNNLDSD